ncbi:hypothetical protein [Micromonospora sp. NBC_00421]|uniref:hypothetical protein n=1 Tax=Micromonospora sp. NBC_00421 TaxID=2975976 RepID=UPI002E2395DC
MFPAAPASPLWWVARWLSRLLTGLAVAIAFAVAGPALSGSALSDPVLPDPGSPAAALSIDAPVSFDAAAALSAPGGGLTGIRTGDQGVDLAGVVAADRVDAVTLTVPAGAARNVPVPPPGATAGRLPTVAGPRAPPAG